MRFLRKSKTWIEDVEKAGEKMIKNCVNCGAPLEGKKCSYCGTMYNDSGIVASFDKDQCTGTLAIGGNEYTVYLGTMEAFTVCGRAGRDSKGRLQMENGRIIHKFTLIEM